MIIDTMHKRHKACFNDISIESPKNERKYSLFTDDLFVYALNAITGVHSSFCAMNEWNQETNTNTIHTQLQSKIKKQMRHKHTYPL